jgi:uroporphyrinogen-III synthase
MKILVLSEMTIYPEIKKICEDKGLAIDKKVIIKINGKHDCYPPKNIQYDVIIFQSKNAVIHCERMWEDIRSRKPVIYCLGKYTSDVVKEKLGLNAIYPKNESSSENLAKIIYTKILETNDYSNKYIIFGGLGGRNVIKRMLKENNQIFYNSDIYERKGDEDIKIGENDLDQNGINYIIVSSKFALKIFLDKTSKFVKKYKLVYVIPNKRIIDDIEDNPNSLVVNNSYEASCYIDAILNNE